MNSLNKIGSRLSSLLWAALLLPFYFYSTPCLPAAEPTPTLVSVTALQLENMLSLIDEQATLIDEQNAQLKSDEDLLKEQQTLRNDALNYCATLEKANKELQINVSTWQIVTAIAAILAIASPIVMAAIK